MSGSCRETTETEKKKNTKYLFKMFHSEHLHCEFQYQILSHCAAKHLMEKTETQGGNLYKHKEERSAVFSVQTDLLDHLLDECLWQSDVLPKQQRGDDLEEQTETRR